MIPKLRTDEHRRASARVPLEPQAAEAWIAAAGRAQRAWGAAPLKRRLQVLRRFRRLLAADAHAIAGCILRRPPFETVAAEVWPILEACRFLERKAPRILACRRPRALGWPAPGRARVAIAREPYGIVLIIGPGNYGLMLAAVQALQALAAGNAVIVKPAPGAREALARFAALLERSGLPAGLLTVVDERRESAETLLECPVDHVVFTGSNRVGRRVLERASARLIPTTLELSGWDACIVLHDADLDRAADALVFSLRLNRGETCVAPRRVIIDAALADPLERRLTARLAEEPLQPFADERTAACAGPLVRDALGAGARLIAGRVERDRVAGPIVLADVTDDMAIFHTEVFAPLLLLCPAAEVDEAIALANSGDYALGASIFGSTRRARAVAAQLRSGLVTINDVVVPLATPEVPLAARGASGFGVTRGAEGLLAMTRPKATTEPRLRFAPHYMPQTAGRARALAALIVLLHGNFEAKLSALRSLMTARRDTEASDSEPVLGAVARSAAPLRSSSRERFEYDD